MHQKNAWSWLKNWSTVDVLDHRIGIKDKCWQRAKLAATGGQTDGVVDHFRPGGAISRHQPAMPIVIRFRNSWPSRPYCHRRIQCGPEGFCAEVQLLSNYLQIDSCFVSARFQIGFKLVIPWYIYGLPGRINFNVNVLLNLAQ